jgi:hypothetical protein
VCPQDGWTNTISSLRDLRFSQLWMLRCSSVVSGCWLSRDLLLRIQLWPRQDLVYGGSEFLRNVVSYLKTTRRHIPRDQNLQFVMSFMFGGCIDGMVVVCPFLWKSGRSLQMISVSWTPYDLTLKYVCNLYSTCQQQFVDRKCYFIVFHNVYFSRAHSFRISYVKKSGKLGAFFYGICGLSL